MSQHHHHDNKGHHHHEEASKSNGWKPGRHNWTFYAAAVLILVAMVIYLLSADLRLRPAAPAQPPVPVGN
jgi:hypothetical protein